MSPFNGVQSYETFGRYIFTSLYIQHFYFHTLKFFTLEIIVGLV